MWLNLSKVAQSVKIGCISWVMSHCASQKKKERRQRVSALAINDFLMGVTEKIIGKQCLG